MIDGEDAVYLKNLEGLVKSRTDQIGEYGSGGREAAGFVKEDSNDGDCRGDPAGRTGRSKLTYYLA